VTYGYDSRVASVRVISPPSVPPAATRFEIRVTGADVNPFFALSAIFGLGIRGIDKKLTLPVPPISHFTLEDKKAGKVRVSPTRISVFNQYDGGKIPMLPQSLEAATERMLRPDSIAREVFGNEFVDHFGGTREHEIKLWNEAVTNWEGEFEVIDAMHEATDSQPVERYLELA
jgi:glutamine synthetase